jgi:hypothetical protein
MKLPEVFALEDVLYSFNHKLACRHVTGTAAFMPHFTEPVHGDAFAIGAAHMLTYTAEERSHGSSFHEAAMNRIIKAMTQGGPTDIDRLKAGGENLVRQYKAEIRKMVAQSVRFDSTHGRTQEAHFVLYRDVPGVLSPDDLQHYAFGKCGKGMLSPDRACGGVFLDDHEKAELGGNTEGIIDRLTDKVLTQIQTLRSRDMLKGSAQKTPPSPG